MPFYPVRPLHAVMAWALYEYSEDGEFKPDRIPLALEFFIHIRDAESDPQDKRILMGYISRLHAAERLTSGIGG